MSEMLVPIGGMLLIFYFILWRPQAKERRLREEMLQALKTGDRVLTTSGIIGVISSLKDTEVVLKVDEKNNFKIRMSRQAIQGLTQPGGAETGKAGKEGKVGKEVAAK